MLRAHGLRAHLRLAVLATPVALALAGCATPWAARTTAPEPTLQWPFAPLPPKVVYSGALTGFAPSRSASRALRAFVFGRDTKEPGRFRLPVAVATSPGGRIAVADLGCGCVHLFDRDRQTYTRLEGTTDHRLRSPVGLAFDERERLFVTDSTGALFAFGAAGEARFVRVRAGDLPLERPTGLAYSKRLRRLYVVDTAASRIVVFGPDGETLGSFGRRGEGDGELNHPTHLVLGPRGRLFVADSLNFRISIFDEEGHPEGVFGRHGDGSGDLAMPKGVAVDADGVVYVADAMFDNVQLFGDRGEFLLTLGRRGTAPGEFWLPSGLHLDADGVLYVCDTYNHRVQLFRIRERYEPHDA